jgi:hypothetical protein
MRCQAFPATIKHCPKAPAQPAACGVGSYAAGLALIVALPIDRLAGRNCAVLITALNQAVKRKYITENVAA